MEKEIINDPNSKPALKPILSSFGVGRASQRKKQEEKLKMKNPENNGFWNYWSSNFGSLKSITSNKDNPNRISPSETIIIIHIIQTTAFYIRKFINLLLG